jgi:hypothetical protein
LEGQAISSVSVHFQFGCWRETLLKLFDLYPGLGNVSSKCNINLLRRFPSSQPSPSNLIIIRAVQDEATPSIIIVKEKKEESEKNQG